MPRQDPTREAIEAVGRWLAEHRPEIWPLWQATIDDRSEPRVTNLVRVFALLGFEAGRHDPVAIDRTEVAKLHDRIREAMRWIDARVDRESNVIDSSRASGQVQIGAVAHARRTAYAEAHNLLDKLLSGEPISEE